MFDTVSLSPVYLELNLKAGVWSGDIAPTQFYDPVNFTKLAITPAKQERVRLLSNMHGTMGEALDTQFKATDPAAVSADIDMFNETLAALILGADVTALSRAGGAITDEAVTTVLNMWVPLANRYLSSSGFSLKTSGDVAVSATKYEVDIHLGMIKAIHADAVGAGMKASYTKATAAGRTFAAGKTKTTYLQLQGVAYDKKSEGYGRLKIHKLSVVSDQEWDLAVGGYLKGTLQGDLITPTGYDSAWEFEPFTLT